MEKMTQGASLLLDGQIAMLLLIPDKYIEFWIRLTGQVNWCDDRSWVGIFAATSIGP